MPKKHKPMPPLEYLRECFVLSEDGTIVWKSRPRSHFKSDTDWTTCNKARAGKEVGKSGINGYRFVGIARKPYLLHRIIYYMFNGVDPGPYEVDHKDTNRSNNSKINLRLANTSENRKNSSLRSDNTSGVKGVTWCSRHNKWQCQIWSNGKASWKQFSDLDEATKWVEQERKRLHGEFSRQRDEIL